MRKVLAYQTLALLVLAGAAGLVWLRTPNGPPNARDILAGYIEHPVLTGIALAYPADGTIFPSEAVPPTFKWTSAMSEVDTWLVRIVFESAPAIEALVTRPEWTPNEETWNAIKLGSVARPARVAILGVDSDAPKTVKASGSSLLSISSDPVGASVFYREVTLPFIEAVKAPERIRWRFGSIDSRTQPPVVLENLPVCGNCHSFSADGRVLGMDVDYANDKGSYVLTETSEEITLTKADVITWSDFRKQDNQPTFGLLSQVSPDGRYAVSTVKDRSVFVPKADIAFSQLFFPLKGILAYYDRQTKTFAALPGADDPRYVHSNPTFSPDGKHIVFARTDAHELKHLKDSGTALLTQEECREFLEEGRVFRFDLYRIPFNEGRGGVAVPLPGASNNRRSNFFARYSPNGKWIVFCQANSFMLLQPDSELYVIPAEGGEARRLNCNTQRMNSWHSWSPNGKWLVFSSKANSDYTQLFLAHMDEQGQCAPPIVLNQFTTPDRAANIPEFVNLPPGAISRIREEFVNDDSYMRTALENLKAGDLLAAERLYRKALSVNPKNADAHAFLGGLLADRGELGEARDHLTHSLRLDPKSSIGHYNWGNLSLKEHRSLDAIRSWKKALELDPKNGKAKQNIGAVLLALDRSADAERFLRSAIATDPADPEAHVALGNVLSKLGRKEAALKQWHEAIRLDDHVPEAHQNLGVVAMETGKLDQAIGHFESALRSAPTNVGCLLNLGSAFAEKGSFAKAIEVTQRAARIAQSSGEHDVALECQRRLLDYNQLLPSN